MMKSQAGGSEFEHVMTKSDDKPLLIAARDLISSLEELGITPVFIGGVAVSLIATPRHTDDLDALIIFDTTNAERTRSMWFPPENEA